MAERWPACGGALIERGVRGAADEFGARFQFQDLDRVPEGLAIGFRHTPHLMIR